MHPWYRTIPRRVLCTYSTDQSHNLIFTHSPSLRMGILPTDIPLHFCIPSLSGAQYCEWDKASTFDLSNRTAPPPKDPFPINRQKVHELAVTKGADSFEKENKIQACIIISVKGKIWFSAGHISQGWLNKLSTLCSAFGCGMQSVVS